MSVQVSREAIGQLREALAVPSAGFSRIMTAGPAVRARYQPIFQMENLPKLTKEDFHSFLIFRNNRHWLGLHRNGPEICSDMKRLRSSLAVLLDESRPIQKRLDDLHPTGCAAVPGMGRAILTAILLVVYPDRYGVWNNCSQASMEKFNLWPDFERAESFGRRYAKVNDVLLDLSRELQIDLWALDGLWWSSTNEAAEFEANDVAMSSPMTLVVGADPQRFGLERHLHDFLRDNWNKTSLGKEWDLHSEDGEVVGYEYPTPIGRIDLLARHRKRKAWLVVELKRHQSSDDTVGQVARYMGYVRERVAARDERVEVLIIAHQDDKRTRYALTTIPDLSLMLYEVDFRLRPSGDQQTKQ